jgi:hypothetical protein
MFRVTTTSRDVAGLAWLLGCWPHNERGDHLPLVRFSKYNSDMTNAPPRTIAEVAPTFADLKGLPLEEQSFLLLARLDAIYSQMQSTGGLNKGNLSLGTDPYGLAAGYGNGENSDVRRHLLGIPWTKLVNQGYLVDPTGSGFYSISDEGKEALRRAKEPVGQHSGQNSQAISERQMSASALGWGGDSRKRLRTAVVLNVLIASPSDVNKERDIVTSAVHSWNDAHRSTTGIMLHPIRWETHSFPASGDRPQAILNRQIVDEGDFLIGIFGNRLGTPTGKAQSGTIEEIERFRQTGKHVALYFSTADVPRSADLDQLKALEDYQRERQKDTLYSTFCTSEELRHLVSQHLPPIVSEVYRGLRSSHKLEGLEAELRNTESRSEQRLQELAAQVKGPLTVNTEFVGEYPDGPRLRVTANRNIIVTQLDYLDERDVRIGSERMEVGGMDFEIPIQYPELVKINNMKPRTGYETIPIGFRLHMVDGDQIAKQRIPAAIQPSYKPINNTTTAFFKLLG